MRAVAAHPDLELVGCFAWSPAKVGQDVGTLCGIDPLGIAATDDVVVGMPETGRRLPGTDDVTGCFLNTLVVRGDLGGDPTGRELLDRVRDQVLGALDHAAVPFERVVDFLVQQLAVGAAPLS